MEMIGLAQEIVALLFSCIHLWDDIEYIYEG